MGVRWEVRESDRTLRILIGVLGNGSKVEYSGGELSFAVRYEEKGSAFFCVLLQKNIAFFTLFYVLCKRTLRSLLSFTFFAKERCVLLRS